MCFSAPKVKQASPPAAPAPAPSEQAPTTLKFNEATANADNAQSAINNKRRGLRSLRIDRTQMSSGSTSGLNIPG